MSTEEGIINSVQRVGPNPACPLRLFFDLFCVRNYVIRKCQLSHSKAGTGINYNYEELLSMSKTAEVMLHKLRQASPASRS